MLTHSLFLPLSLSLPPSLSLSLALSPPLSASLLSSLSLPHFPSFSLSLSLCLFILPLLFLCILSPSLSILELISHMRIKSRPIGNLLARLPRITVICDPECICMHECLLCQAAITFTQSNTGSVNTLMFTICFLENESSSLPILMCVRYVCVCGCVYVCVCV